MIAVESRLIGDCWTLLILREAFYGVQRYDDMRADVLTESGRAVALTLLALTQWDETWVLGRPRCRSLTARRVKRCALRL
jgi:DNA-binding HxlR family transcriptional regulator